MAKPASGSMFDMAAYYAVELGWSLTPIRPRSKAPMPMEWNSEAAVVRTAEVVRSTWGGNQQFGIGLVHEFSGTGAFDIDSAEWAAVAFAEFGIEINELIDGCPQIVGREGRGKAVFRVPKGLAPIKLVWPAPSSGGRPITVFELRAGAVQDVLPPSIHPDTGRPYTWAVAPWDMDEIPDAPGELLAIWSDWASFKPQFEAACPWAPKQAPLAQPVARAMSRQNDNIIGQFNERSDVASMLESRGYKRRGKRWLAPTSSSGIAGVVLLDGRCYSHHASDPLNNGHANDAFDLFCLLDHGGDYRSALSAARSLLGPTATPASSIEAFLKTIPAARAPVPVKEPEAPRSSSADMPEVPRHLLTVPGALGRAVDWIAATAHKPQPLFDVQAALGLGSVACARRYRTDNNNWSSLYLVNVGRSGSGKEHAKHAIEQLLDAGGLGHLVGPGRFASESGVLSCLLQSPATIAIVDEFGKTLEEASHPNNIMAHGTLRYLLEVFGRAGGVLRPVAYSTAGMSSRQSEEMARRFVRNPGLTLFGMTTPEPLFAAVGSGWVRDGSLNRLIVVHSEVGRQPARRVQGVELPGDLVEWLQEIRARNPGGGNLGAVDPAATEVPTPTVLEIKAAALAMFDAFERDNIAWGDRLDEEGLGEMTTRMTELSMRVALIVALSCGAANVRADDASWAIEYVRIHAQRNVEQLRAHLADSPFERLVNQIKSFVLRAGARGATVRDLQAGCRAFRAAPSRLADDALARLVHSEQIHVVEMKPMSGRGRPRKAFVAGDGADMCDKRDEV